MDAKIAESTDTNYIDVFPLRCGIGKTTYIKYAISDALRSGRGLIVITDSVDRMQEYTRNQTDDDLSEYVGKNRRKIVILNSANFSDEVRTVKYKQIVLMTTQRYFDMTPEEIAELTKYAGGVRDKIIFDEKIYITENIEIRVKTINDIDTALHEHIDDTDNSEDKAWLISQWESFRDRIFAIIKMYETENDGYSLEKWHYISGDSISEDDERFKKLIHYYRKKINRISGVYKALLAVIQIVENGATFTSQKLKSKPSNSEYNNYFTVILDNRDKLINIGAKIFVLDGTADIDPDYQREYVKMIACDQFKTTYPSLTIQCVNINTSRTKLCSRNNGNKVIKMIMEYVNTLPVKYDVLFTYENVAHKLKDEFVQTDYFGNIKGKNRYREYNNFVQIGLNRFSDLTYRLKTYHNVISNVTTDGEVVKFISRKASEEKAKETMYRAIMSDIEQNLFRSKLRNPDCKEPVRYLMFFNTDEFKPMIELMQERYKEANVFVTDTPTSFLIEQIKSRENSKDSKTQRIIDWLSEQPNGTTFKVSDMLNELGITQQKFKDAKKYNKSLVKIFKSMETNRRGYYTVRR